MKSRKYYNKGLKKIENLFKDEKDEKYKSIIKTAYKLGYQNRISDQFNEEGIDI
jgi:hypothetical protein